MKYCLGTVQFGMQYGVQNNDRPDQNSVFSILDFAIANGINMFDTAAAYGDSEKVLGRYILKKNLNSSHLKIISKISSQALHDFNDISIISDNVNESLSNLKLDKLYAILFHDSTSVFHSEYISTLIKFKNSNLVSKVGVSIYTPEEALKATEYDIDIIQIPYNLFDNRLDKNNFFEIAKNKGIEIFARSSLLQGLLLMDYNNLPLNMQFSKEYLQKFCNIIAKYNINKLNAAIGYVATNKYIDYIVFGVDNINHLREYLSINLNGLPLDVINDFNVAFSNTNEKLVNPSLWR